MAALTTGAVAVSAPATPRRMTFEEYLACGSEQGLAEWVNGEVVTYMSATELHQRIAVFLSFVLQGFIRLRALGKIRTAPYAMRALAGGNAREPDLVFVATAHLNRLGQTFLDGPADLVVEIISEDSVARDRDEKFSEYQDAGVREYWLIDPRPNRRRADFYVLVEQGHFQPVPIPADNRYRSTVLPGLWLDVNWLWQDDPNELEALARVIGPDELPSPLRARTEQHD